MSQRRSYEVNMQKLLFIVGLFLVLNMGLASAHEHDLEETKQLIDSAISCENLTDEQLESIGEYYMEQMHPGEAHELMDKMMGGEGSEGLKSMHIQIARVLYCDEEEMMGSGGMMGMMPMISGQSQMQTDMMQGMMGNNTGTVVLVFWIILIVVLVLLAVWLYKKISEKTEDALEILKKRFARGEITKEEYESIKKELEQKDIDVDQ